MLLRIAEGIDVAPTLGALERAPELWGQHPERTAPEDSPHRESEDIWLRFRPLEELTSPESYSEPHFAAWYPAMNRLPTLRPIIFDVMHRMQAVYLGGCMLTRLPAGRQIYRHTDSGWHASFLNTKLYVILQSNSGCVNTCGRMSVVMKAGDVWQFDNSLPHSVTNMGEHGPDCSNPDVPVRAVKRAKHQPVQTDIHLCEGLFVKHAIFAQNTYIPQHSHESDHLSVVATGAVRVWQDGELMGDYRAPAGIVIRARVKHLFLALEPMTTVLCIHRVDESGEVAIHAEHNLVLED